MSTDLIEAPTSAAPSSLAMIVMDPAKYVAELYAPFRAKFNAAKAAADAVAIDCSTTAGNALAIKHRAVFRDEIRLALESVRVERKAPILEIGRLIDSNAKEIAAEVAPYEAKFDAAIKAETARKEALKAAEQVRKDKIRADIDGFRDIPARLAGKSVADLDFALRDMNSMEVAESRFAEFTADAVKVVATVIKAIEGMLAAAVEAVAVAAAAEQARLAEVARIAAEREEMARQRAENQRVAAEQAATAKALAEQQAAIERAAQQQREQAEANARAEAAARAEAERLAQAERERVAAGVKAQLEQQQADIAAQQRAAQAAIDEQARKLAEQRAAADARDAAAAAQAQRDEAHGEALAMDEQFDIDAAVAAAQVVLPVTPAPADAAPAALAEQFATVDVGPTDAEIIEDIAMQFDLTTAEAIDRLERIDFAAARAALAVAA